jgi:hypothetical protein
MIRKLLKLFGLLGLSLSLIGLLFAKWQFFHGISLFLRRSHELTVSDLLSELPNLSQDFRIRLVQVLKVLYAEDVSREMLENAALAITEILDDISKQHHIDSAVLRTVRIQIFTDLNRDYSQDIEALQRMFHARTIPDSLRGKIRKILSKINISL